MKRSIVILLMLAVPVLVSAELAGNSSHVEGQVASGGSKALTVEPEVLSGTQTDYDSAVGYSLLGHHTGPNKQLQTMPQLKGTPPPTLDNGGGEWLHNDSGTPRAYFPGANQGFIWAERFFPTYTEFTVDSVLFYVYSYYYSATATLTFRIHLYEDDGTVTSDNCPGGVVDCDGPGTEVWISTDLTTPMGNPFRWCTFNVPDCTFSGNFIVGIEVRQGGDSLSLLLGNQNGPCCCTNFYYSDYHEPTWKWYEHWNFWDIPQDIGYNMIRAYGYGYKNEPPVAYAGGSYAGEVGDEITFDASGSCDPDGGVVGYRWDWTNNGSWDTGWLNDPVTTHIYDSEFHGQVVLEVEDDEGDRDTDMADVDIEPSSNLPPIANAGGPYWGITGELIQFDGTGSYDTDGEIVSYDWKIWDDPWQNDIGPTPTFTFGIDDIGTLAVWLRVTDDDGATDVSQTEVTIMESGADVQFSYPGDLECSSHDPLTYEGCFQGASIPDGTPIDIIDWTTGDLVCTFYMNASEFCGEPSHSGGFFFQDVPCPWIEGRLVYCKIEYEDYRYVSSVYGLNEGSNYFPLFEDDWDCNEPPVADVGGPYSAVVWQQVTLDASSSHDPDGDIVQYDWKMHYAGDWHNDVGPTATTTYDVAGTYQVIVRVHDDAGASMNDTTTISVSSDPNLPPIAYIDYVGPNPAVQGQEVEFRGHGREVAGGDETIVGFEWTTIVDGGAEEELSTDATFTTSSLPVGNHTIFFRVKNVNDIWSPKVEHSLFVTEDEIFETVITPPYFSKLCGDDFTGCGLVATCVNNCNHDAGILCAYATAWIGGGYAAAWQILKFHVHNEKDVHITGRLIGLHGAPTTGLASFASTKKLIGYDLDHDNVLFEQNEWIGSYIDPPLTPRSAFLKLVNIASMILGEVVTDPGIADLFEILGLLAELADLREYMDAEASNDEQTETDVSFWVHADPSVLIHTIGIGVRSDVSGCVFGTATAIFGGALESIRLQGIYPPNIPIITGPEFGYVDSPCLALAQGTDVNEEDDLQFSFAWEDGPVTDWSDDFFQQGQLAPSVHVYDEPGIYEVKAQAWDGDYYITLGGQIDSMISEWSSAHTIVVGYGAPLGVSGFCPIDLCVTDPEGHTISKDNSEIDYASYEEVDLDEDGDLDDHIFIPFAMDGIYTIEAIPEPGADPSETFSIHITFDEDSFVLAKDVPISSISDEPYVFYSGEDTTLVREDYPAWQLHMISLPLQPSCPYVTCVFEDDLGPWEPGGDWILKYWNGSSYDVYGEPGSDFPEPLVPGQAYWLQTSDTVDIDVIGMLVDSTQDYVIPLQPGFRCIGNPFNFPVEWDSLRVRKDGVTRSIKEPHAHRWIVNHFWFWDGHDWNARQHGSLVPWEGYRVRVHQDCELLFPPIPSTPEEQIASATPGRDAVPTEYALYQNYPNPFNPTTIIRYDVKETGLVSLKIFNLLGREVVTLAYGKIPAGSYTATWDATGLPSGIYLCRMDAERFTQTRKLLLVK